MVIFSFFVNLLMLTVPLYLLQLYDRVIPNHNSDTLIFLTLLAILALVTLATLEYVRSSILKQLGNWLDAQLSSHILSASIARSVRKNKTSSARIFEDLAVIRNFLSGNTLLSLLDVPWSPFFIAVLFSLHPMIGGITLAGVLILVGLALLNEYSSRGNSKQSHRASNNLMDYAAAVMRNAEVIEAMGMRRQLMHRWNKKNDESLALYSKTISRTAWITSAAKFFRFLLQIAIVCSAAWLIMSNQLTGGAMMASLLLMRRAVAPMEQAINSWKSVLQVRNAISDVGYRLDNSPTLQSPKQKILPQPGDRLKVDHISYHYNRNSKSILDNISFSLKPGRTLGIGGETAVGKSTLARLLVGIVKPSSGRVRLGGINVQKMDTDELGAFIGFLPQDVELFSGTIHENIARMSDGDLQSVIEAAFTAGVHEMIMDLPDKYETQIGEDGTQLSGGQRQRIALARAVYGNPSLIILDEPDANLDFKGRYILTKVIKRLKAKGTMLIIISHDPGMLAMTDSIVELYPTKYGSSSRLRSTNRLREQSESKSHSEKNIAQSSDKQIKSPVQAKSIISPIREKSSTERRSKTSNPNKSFKPNVRLLENE